MCVCVHERLCACKCAHVLYVYAYVREHVWKLTCLSEREKFTLQAQTMGNGERSGQLRKGTVEIHVVHANREALGLHAMNRARANSHAYAMCSKHLRGTYDILVDVRGPSCMLLPALRRNRLRLRCAAWCEGTHTKQAMPSRMPQWNLPFRSTLRSMMLHVFVVGSFSFCHHRHFLDPPRWWCLDRCFESLMECLLHLLPCHGYYCLQATQLALLPGRLWPLLLHHLSFRASNQVSSCNQSCPRPCLLFFLVECVGSYLSDCSCQILAVYCLLRV